MRLAATAGWRALVFVPAFLAVAGTILLFQLLLLTLAFFVMQFPSVGVDAALADAQRIARGLAWGTGVLVAWNVLALVLFLVRRDARPPPWRLALGGFAHLGALLVFSVAAVYLVRDLAAPGLALGLFLGMKIALDAGLHRLDDAVVRIG